MRRCEQLMCAAVVAGAGMMMSSATQENAPTPAATTPAATTRRAALPNLHERLAALWPTDAGEYFLLGEELAAEATEPGDRRLARELLVLACELDERQRIASGVAPNESRNSTVPERLAASVCLVLASIAESPEQRDWLLALAAANDAGAEASAGASAPRAAAIGETVDDATAFDLATAIGLMRAGEGRLALRLLDRPEVAALLKKLEGLLTPTGGSGGADRVRSLAERYQFCPECRNRRWTKNAAGVHVCPTCGGHPGPAITGDEYLYELRLESVLLSGAGDDDGGEASGLRSWAAQVVIDHGAPLRELDLHELSAVFNVDVSRPIWKDGAWTPEK